MLSSFAIMRLSVRRLCNAFAILLTTLGEAVVILRLCLVMTCSKSTYGGRKLSRKDKQTLLVPGLRKDCGCGAHAFLLFQKVQNSPVKGTNIISNYT